MIRESPHRAGLLDTQNCHGGNFESYLWGALNYDILNGEVHSAVPEESDLCPLYGTQNSDVVQDQSCVVLFGALNCFHLGTYEVYLASQKCYFLLFV